MAGEIKMTRKFIALFFIGVVLAVFLGIVAGQYFTQWRMEKAQAKFLAEHPATTLKPGDLIPNFSFVTLDGKEQKLYEQLQYDKAILFFLTTTCGYCAQEIQMWKQQMASLPKGIQVIAISNEPLDKLINFSREKELPFALFCDQGGKFFEQYKVNSFPVMVLVDGKMKVVKVLSGYDPKLEVKDYVKTLAMN